MRVKLPRPPAFDQEVRLARFCVEDGHPERAALVLRQLADALEDYHGKRSAILVDFVAQCRAGDVLEGAQ